MSIYSAADWDVEQSTRYDRRKKVSRSIVGAPEQWSEERENHLRKLWDENVSASQIAKLMGGVSRNAVLGKVHRLGLASRKDHPRRPYVSPTWVPRPKVDRPEKPKKDHQFSLLLFKPRPGTEATESVVPIPDAPRVALVDLKLSHCRFPLGDPGSPDFGFCGAEKYGALPYCAGHARICYRPSKYGSGCK